MCISFIFFINNSRICIRFEADRVEKVQKLAYLKFFGKMSDKKVIDEQMVKIQVDLQ